MNAAASLISAPAVAGISVIAVYGEGAKKIIKKVFDGRGDLKTGEILHGKIKDGEKIIDEVIIGCEEQNSFAINCHGNPLIVENILLLLKKNGAEVISAQKMAELLAKKKFANDSIAAEAEIVLADCATVFGAKLVEKNKTALKETAENWLQSKNIENVRRQATEILENSKAAEYFIRCAKIVLTGLPNCGKSTLFNYLCGYQKAIVADVAGTTRDWLSAEIKLPHIAAEIFDTAGIATEICRNDIDCQSQLLAKQVAANGDLAVVVIDATEPKEFEMSAENSIKVLNKCDVAWPAEQNGIKISAKTGDGIEDMLMAVEEKLGVYNFDAEKVVCFTNRQKKLLEKIANEPDRQSITELLNGQINV